MRAGIVVSGATAIAAFATAAMIQLDALGRLGGPSRTAAAPAKSSEPPKKVADASAAPTVRQIPAPTAPAPAVPPTPITPTPVQTIAVPGPAPVAPVAPIALPPRPAVETTGSVAPSRTLFVSGTRVALRQSPDAKSTALQRMEKGQRLVELARNGDWVRVRLAPGDAEGWVSATLVGADRPN